MERNKQFVHHYSIIVTCSGVSIIQSCTQKQKQPSFFFAEGKEYVPVSILSLYMSCSTVGAPQHGGYMLFQNILNIAIIGEIITARVSRDSTNRPFCALRHAGNTKRSLKVVFWPHTWKINTPRLSWGWRGGGASVIIDVKNKYWNLICTNGRRMLTPIHFTSREVHVSWNGLFLQKDFRKKKKKFEFPSFFNHKRIQNLHDWVNIESEVDIFPDKSITLT